MTALAVERPAPAWAGRAIVRAAGRMELHVTVEGVEVPAAAMFTVPVECRPDASSAPGVRPWAGPVDERRLCAACMRALRGEPEPEQVQLATSGTVMVPPPEPGPEGRGRHLRVIPDLPTYTAPSLPTEHDGRPIRWSEWGAAPYSSACDWCGAHGPCVLAGGRQGNPLAKDNPLRWFVAHRCSYCQQTRVYEQAGTAKLKPIAHFQPESPRSARA
ncbi:hypothetical protein [Streptomyces sp. NRRL S-920]|uniref:hypothetical protein n=1 Tax=Streptomyces sp. NRRL S-920 TaxID=1463921 RepID=UPI0004C8881D|nr:hypothetical protein [Streptomyces sp. NRRL S-920]